MGSEGRHSFFAGALRLMRGAAAALAVLLASFAPAAADGHVAVISSHDAGPHREIEEAFRRRLASEAGGISVETRILSDQGTSAGELVRQCRRENPRVIFTIGSLATRSTLHEVRDTPIVSSLTLMGDKLARASNATGVVLDFSEETELGWIRKILPAAGSVGVLYSPRENTAKVERAQEAAVALDLRIVPFEVSSPRDIPLALKNMSREVDVLWGISDRVLMAPGTARQIMLVTFRGRIPFVGLSPTWVKAGALYSLDRDYADIGAQSADLTARILDGTDLSELPPEPPRRIRYSLNRKTAEHLRIDIPRSILDGAREIY